MGYKSGPHSKTILGSQSYASHDVHEYCKLAVRKHSGLYTARLVNIVYSCMHTYPIVNLMTSWDTKSVAAQKKQFYPIMMLIISLERRIQWNPGS